MTASAPASKGNLPPAALTSPPPEQSAPGHARRRRALWVAGAVVALLAAATGVHLLLTRGDEETDDAFVEADVVAVAPRGGGTIAEVRVAENAPVEPADVLLRIDDADLQARVRQAEAEFDTAR